MESTSTKRFTLELQEAVSSMQGVGDSEYELENEACAHNSVSMDGYLTQSIFRRKQSGERFQVSVIKLDD
jgi:hypothetical protein